MAGIAGMKWDTREFNDVASSLDDLTKQLMLANQMNAADILHRQKVIDTADYQEFLLKVFRQE